MTFFTKTKACSKVKCTFQIHYFLLIWGPNKFNEFWYCRHFWEKFHAQKIFPEVFRDANQIKPTTQFSVRIQWINCFFCTWLLQCNCNFLQANWMYSKMHWIHSLLGDWRWCIKKFQSTQQYFCVKFYLTFYFSFCRGIVINW